MAKPSLALKVRVLVGRCRPYTVGLELSPLPQGQSSLGGSLRVNGREAERWEAGSRAADRWVGVMPRDGRKGGREGRAAPPRPPNTHTAHTH